MKKENIIIITVVNCLLNQYAYKKKRKERKERRGGKRIHIKRFLMTDRMQGSSHKDVSARKDMLPIGQQRESSEKRERMVTQRRL